MDCQDKFLKLKWEIAPVMIDEPSIFIDLMPQNRAACFHINKIDIFP